MISALGELHCNTFQLTGYMLLSETKKNICCFMRATHAINNTDKFF